MNQPCKGILAILLLFCSIGFAQAAEQPKESPTQPSQASPSPQATPSIQVPEPSHDFGEAMEGAEITHEFKVKNSGKGVLQIEQVRPG